jgi:8-oxo-dGTP pyrophosphatase MutT (NUDIX family)
MGQIRVIVLGLVQSGDRLLVAEGYDIVKRESFYRPLGGGVEFGETSLAALKREFWEEIQAELVNICYLGCLENLFTFNGERGHEWVQLYRCGFANSWFYQQAKWTFIEPENAQHQPIQASWVELARFRTGELRLVPEACLQYLEESI